MEQKKKAQQLPIKGKVRTSSKINNKIKIQQDNNNIYMHKLVDILRWSSQEKPEEDAEAHLLCSNDWMNAHCFVDGIKSPKILSYIS